MSFYEKICEAREILLFADTSLKSRNEKMKILSQLMVHAFNNEQKTDELPQIFRLRNLEFVHSEQIEWILLHCVKLNVKSVTLIDTDYVTGRVFEIELF